MSVRRGRTARPPRRRSHLAPAHEVEPARGDLMGTQRLLVVRRARWRVDEPGASTAAEETAHGVHPPAGNVLAKRPDWQAWRRLLGRGRHGPARGL